MESTGLRWECTEASFAFVPVIILLADGVRPDTLEAALDSDALPALARLRDEGGRRDAAGAERRGDRGGLFTVTSCFPSVTGPAYAPFLMGRYPGPIGLPGLRWFDRSHGVCTFPDYSRSYVGYQMGMVDGDIDPEAPTIFELCGTSLGALNVIGRGLPRESRIASLTPRSAFRAAKTHFTGNVAGWLDIDRDVGQDLVRRVRDERPEFVFAAFTGVDKVSHARGQSSSMVLEALSIVDAVAAEIRADAERSGRWRELSIWVVSDHGHSPVAAHEDLAGVVSDAGYRTISHPWVFAVAPDVAVMVSGNAMAHLYVGLDCRDRRSIDVAGAWPGLVELLLPRPSVDLLMYRHADKTLVRTAGRGSAEIWLDARGYHYRRVSGDPLGLGRDLCGIDTLGAYDAAIDTDYPDGIVQIVHLMNAPRCGDIVLSAARQWDFRAHHEPIPHVSSHGALHREHMLVPLLISRPIGGLPRRTVDVMPSALTVLGKRVPPGLDGLSFI